MPDNGSHYYYITHLCVVSLPIGHRLGRAQRFPDGKGGPPGGLYGHPGIGMKGGQGLPFKTTSNPPRPGGGSEHSLVRSIPQLPPYPTPASNLSYQQYNLPFERWLSGKQTSNFCSAPVFFLIPSPRGCAYGWVSDQKFQTLAHILWLLIKCGRLFVGGGFTHRPQFISIGLNLGSEIAISACLTCKVFFCCQTLYPSWGQEGGQVAYKGPEVGGGGGGGKSW